MPAGIVDVATGMLAVVVAAMLASKASEAHSAAYGWYLFGIADLVVAVSMGTLTSAGRTHLIALDVPNMLISAYPLAMIPTFAAAQSFILHGACLWRLSFMGLASGNSAAFAPRANKRGPALIDDD